MAKRREKPAQNPLRRDLVSSIAGPAPQPQDSGGGVAVADPPPALPILPVPGPEEQIEPETSLVSERKPRRRRDPSKTWEKSTKTMKTRFVPAEADQNAEFTALLSSRVRPRGSDVSKQTVTESHITRALWSLARRAGDNLDEMDVKVPKLHRPPHGDKFAMAEFEDALADFLLAAFKKLRRGE